MRADSARNLEVVLQTSARLLADDPGVSVAAIAAAAGVDRRTVYRKFANREALLRAVSHAKLDAVDDVLTQSRLTEAPVRVALHRLVEGAVEVARRYPVKQDQMDASPSLHGRHLEQRERIEAFLRRAAEDGTIRRDLLDGIAFLYLDSVVDVMAHHHPQWDGGRAADLAVGVLLNGIGA